MILNSDRGRVDKVLLETRFVRIWDCDCAIKAVWIGSTQTHTRHNGSLLELRSMRFVGTMLRLVSLWRMLCRLRPILGYVFYISIGFWRCDNNWPISAISGWIIKLH